MFRAIPSDGRPIGPVDGLYGSNRVVVGPSRRFFEPAGCSISELPTIRQSERIGIYL